MKIPYKETNLSRRSLAVVAQANLIIDEYAEQGFDLTLRQLYYQFVSRDLIPNRDSEYKKLGSVINNARLAGLIDWDRIEDRTRYVRTYPHWESPESIIRSAAASYREDLWENQPCYVEVWIEKDALVGVLDSACKDRRVPYFSCRGYTSASEMWRSSMRFIRAAQHGKETHLIHLGDHDPSGIDMTRDISDRLAMFCEYHGVETPVVHRIALTYEQVEEYNPPPNPAKWTDSRCEGYVSLYGDSSWELDALDPRTLSDLINDHVSELILPTPWRASERNEKKGRKILSLISERYRDVLDLIGEDL